MQRSATCLLLLLAICIGAFLTRAEGIKWPQLHPDEIVIGTWLQQSARCVYIKDRVYPNGYFVLARPFVLAGRALINLRDRFDYHCGALNRIRDVRFDGIYFGRWFNAWVGTLLCVVVFLFVSRVARSRWAGLWAAGLIGFAQYAVEHSHYAETDIAAVLVLTCALWLWIIARDTYGMRWLMAAAFVSGFAAGTKFTMAALVALVLVESVLFAGRRLKTGGWLSFGGTLCLAGLLCGAGFIFANPAVLLDWQWFWAGMATEKQRVFAETILNLGPLGAQPGVKSLHHFWSFCGHALTLGWPWLVLIATGLLCLALLPGGNAPRAEGPRRYWTVLLLWPGLYAAYWLFLAPWVRSQEFLLFLPSFAALAVLPLVALWRMNYFTGRVLVLLIGLMALLVNGDGGRRVARQFGWKDTRLQAMEWLQVRLPTGSRIAAEAYAEAACPVTLHPPLSIKKIERDGIQLLLGSGADYLLRAASVAGRGLRHPLTGELYPGPAENLKQFIGGSTLLCSWAPLPPQGLATFSSPVIELYGLKFFPSVLSLRVALPQPALIVNCDQNAAGRETFCLAGRWLGCDTVLLVDRLPQTMAVGGPERLSAPVFLVLNTMERPAVVHVRGFGRRHKVSLAPYDTCALALERPAWDPRTEPFESITLSAEPVKDVLYIPCFARVVFTVDETVRIFLDTAREDKIAGYFSEELLERELSPELQYIVAARLGLPSMAERSQRQAFEVRTAIEQCLQTTSASVSINGVSGYYYEQFARVRLQQPYELACGPRRDAYARTPLQHALAVLDLQVPEAREAGQVINPFPRNSDYYQTLTLPVLVARGKYELRGEVMMRMTSKQGTSAIPVTAKILGAPGKSCSIGLEPGRWHDFSMFIQPGREIQPCLELRAPMAGQVHLRNMELVWTLTSAIETLRDELAAADQARPEADRALASRQFLARYPPWLALVDFNFDSGSRQVKCVWEALRDDTPKLAVTFWVKRRGAWRRKQSQPLGAKQWMQRREREVVIGRLGADFGAAPDPDNIGLGVETDVMWHPGSIASSDGGYVVPFSSLIRVPAAGQSR